MGREPNLTLRSRRGEMLICERVSELSEYGFAKESKSFSVGFCLFVCFDKELMWVCRIP